jgi:hypothetical protein
MIDYENDANFAGNSLGAPGKVAGIDAEGAVFLIAAASAHEMDTLSSNAGVGWLTTFLKRSGDCEYEWLLTLVYFCPHLFLR